MESRIQKELERDYENGMYRRLGISFDRFMDERCEQAKKLHAQKQLNQGKRNRRGRPEKQEEDGANED